MARRYGSFMGWLIHVRVQPYMYARPAAALWNCHRVAPTWAGTGSHRYRQDSLTLCLRSHCQKRQNSLADGRQNSRDNGVLTDAYMYPRHPHKHIQHTVHMPGIIRNEGAAHEKQRAAYENSSLFFVWQKFGAKTEHLHQVTSPSILHVTPKY